MLRSLAWLTAGLSVAATALAVNTAPRATAAPNTSASREVAASEDNPKVKPGLVNWHASAADARAAAQRSGRPVLVFHMMGQLDRQFC